MNSKIFCSVLFGKGNPFNKMVSLCTYVPVRLLRGALVHLAEKMYKTKEISKGEKLGLLLAKSKVKNLPLFLKLPDGNTIYLPLLDMSTFIAFIDVYDHAEYEKFYVPKNGDIILDVGAHIGAFTLKTCRFNRNGLVVAVEPDPHNFELLRKNVQLNSCCERVILVNAVLSDKNGHCTFYRNECFSAGSSLTTKREYSRQVDTKAFKLDSLVDELRLKRIDFLKVDAEGAELEITRGAERALREQLIRNMAIAAYHVSEQRREQIIKMLKSCEYRIISTFDNIIYAAA